MAGRRNRKRQSDGFIFPAPFACVLGIAAFVALSYLWFCGRCEAIGTRIKVLEEQKAELRKQVVNEEFKWSNMKSPSNIEALLRHFGLTMTWPDKNSVVKINGSPRAARTISLPAQYASSRRIMVND